MLILPIYEHKASFRFLVSSVSFNNIVFSSFQYTGPLSPLLFIPSYFILFVAIVNGILFISFSGILLLAYKNATDFCTLNLYPATLLYSFIISFFVVFLVFNFFNFFYCSIVYYF